jgi:hypothetical protein
MSVIRVTVHKHKSRSDKRTEGRVSDSVLSPAAESSKDSLHILDDGCLALFK